MKAIEKLGRPWMTREEILGKTKHRKARVDTVREVMGMADYGTKAYGSLGKKMPA